MPTWSIVLITAIASYAVSLVVRALTSREKKVTHEIESECCVTDAQFLRSIEGVERTETSVVLSTKVERTGVGTALDMVVADRAERVEA